MLLVLGQDQQGELHTLIGIQPALCQQRAKVDEQRRGLARHRGHSLELIDGLLCAQSALQQAPLCSGGEESVSTTQDQMLLLYLI